MAKSRLPRFFTPLAWWSFNQRAAIKGMKNFIFNPKTSFSFLIFATTITSATGQSLALDGKGTNDLAFCNVYANEEWENHSINKTISIIIEDKKGEVGTTSLSHNNAANNFNNSPCPPAVYRDVAYRDIFYYSNRSFEMSLCGGALGINSKKTLGCFGFNMALYGFYFDCLAKPRFHESSTDVKKWDDSFGVAFHAGYQIPIVDWFRIIPEIGYFSVSEGTTDGSKYTVDKDGIHNKYTADWKDNGLDYGVVVVLQLFDCFNLDFSITRNTMYGGLGLAYHF
ncbi:MAG: hypothetical protein J6U04_11285 [Salinivirgaceae bacterium]|nr:hypothetical protein [Salinivirgaceae bacterium]